MAKSMLILISVVCVLTFTTCTKNNTSTNPDDPATMDRQAITNLINDEYANLLADASYYGIEDTTEGKNKPFSPINLIYWYRHPTSSIAKDFTIDISNDTAFVTISFTGSGLLRLFFFDQGNIDSISKNFSDDFERSAIFVRIGTQNDTHRGWRLRGISPAIIATPGTALTIDSVSIHCSDSFYLFTSAQLNSVWPVNDSLSGIPEITPGDSITITYYVKGDTADAYLHIGWDNSHERYLLHPDQNGTVFSRSLRLRDSLPPKVNLAFDLIRHSALHTTEGIYSSTAYVIPVRSN